MLTSPTLAKSDGVPVYTLDEIVDTLGLDRVDFIKMDIEGAEPEALKGAERTIVRFKPKLAISVYHLENEPASVCATVMKIQPKYRIAVKDLMVGADYLGPKVMFFNECVGLLSEIIDFTVVTLRLRRDQTLQLDLSLARARFSLRERRART